MNKKETQQLQNALKEAINGDDKNLDFFADFDKTLPPIEMIYAAVDGADAPEEDAEKAFDAPRRTDARRQRRYYRSFAAIAACFAVIIVSLAASGGFITLGQGLADGMATLAPSENKSADADDGASDMASAAESAAYDLASGEEEMNAAPSTDETQETAPQNEQDAAKEYGSADSTQTQDAAEAQRETSQENAPAEAEIAAGAPGLSEPVGADAESGDSPHSILFGILAMSAALLLSLLLVFSARVRETAIGALYRITALRILLVAASMALAVLGILSLAITP